jgi:hypothetical protein
MAFLSSGEREKKLRGARWGDYGGHGRTVTCDSASSSWTSTERCAGALLSTNCIDATADCWDKRSRDTAPTRGSMYLL